MSVRKARCARLILLEAYPCILHSQTRAVAPQQQEDLHAPQPAGDPVHQTGAATWQPTGAKKENQLHSQLPRSLRTRLDCADDDDKSVKMIAICIGTVKEEGSY
jgi:hypothetical protein